MVKGLEVEVNVEQSQASWVGNTQSWGYSLQVCSYVFIIHFNLLINLSSSKLDQKVMEEKMKESKKVETDFQPPLLLPPTIMILPSAKRVSVGYHLALVILMVSGNSTISHFPSSQGVKNLIDWIPSRSPKSAAPVKSVTTGFPPTLWFGFGDGMIK